MTDSDTSTTSTWQVHKFGGTSVASAECFLLVAQILSRAVSSSSNKHNNNTRLAIVVSAVGGKPKTTDLLLSSVQLAASRQPIVDIVAQIRSKHETILKELFPNNYSDLLSIIDQDLNDIQDILKTVYLMKWKANRISELISGYGELWSTQILCQLLNQQHNPHQTYQYVDARTVITIDEDAIQDGAVCWDISKQKLQTILQNKQQQQSHLVMTGYVASNTEGVSTTLQRDGSDYSAAILGRLIQADSVTIWTDVDGVLSADPRRVPLAQVVPQVSFSEAMELAYFGAKVIHPKTMQPAVLAGIPIYIRNTFRSHYPGSRIFTTSTTHKDQVVCAFSSIEHMAIVNVEGSGLIGVPGVAKRLFGTLERVGVNVVLISQASSEHSITFATTERQAVTAKEVIEEEFRRELDQNRISNVDIKAPCSIIAAVGDGMIHTTGCAGRFFSALGDAKINILAIAQGCSERNISAVVFSSDSIRALRAVHSAFRLSHTTVRIGIIGMTDIGESLLRLLDTQRNQLRSTFDLDLQVCVVLPDCEQKSIVCLKHDTDARSDSITMGAFNEARKSFASTSEGHTTFKDEKDTAKIVDGGLDLVRGYLWRDACTNHVIFDCTNQESVGIRHADWLNTHIDVVTANNTGLSGSKEVRAAIREAETCNGKQSAKYLREVTVGGGLPVLKTLRTLLDSGDRVRRVDGILSVSLSYIFFRVSPPPDFDRGSEFDERSSLGAFEGDVLPTGVGKPCTFSEAVKEAIDLGLMEKDPSHDLSNEYTSRVLMVLAQELGMADELEFKDIQRGGDAILEEGIDFASADIDAMIQARVDSARSHGCVLRHISSVDVHAKKVQIEIMEVPERHLFAVTPPSCECVRFFTRRHRSYPLIVHGPSAGVDSTASALLAELLHLMRGKSSPRSVALSRSTSGAALQC